MKNEQLYHKTVGILVDAYMNDTLVHGSCHACAVGNIINSNLGLGFEKCSFTERLLWNVTIPMWDRLFMTFFSKQMIIESAYEYTLVREQIDCTGYCWQDLAKIEYAFETGNVGSTTDEKMFNGLMAVIDVLDKIHEVDSVEISSTSKNKFSKPCLQNS